MKFNYLFRKTDKLLLFVILLLVSFGSLMIYSSTHASGKGFYDLQRQIIWIITGFVILIPIAFMDYRRYKGYYFFIYGLNIFILSIVFVRGILTSGVERWIQIGPFTFQPSEFSKIFMILFLASFFCERELNPISANDIFKAFLYLLPPMFLIYFQPDLGTALALIVIFLGMLLLAGARWWHFGVFVLVGIVLVFSIFQFNILKPYQMNRLFVFINPDLDPQSAGYNLNQAKIAIGSGGIFGKGLLSGTQTNLRFLPARHTDFIFAVIGEELGLLGALSLLLLFFFLNFRVIRIALTAKDIFGSFLAIGIFSMWLFQILTNIGMNIGIMPITGIPLPFISYGGSAMWVNMISVGILLNIYRERYG
ncbi:MAG: rod shape-determining protein RodA [Actinomycetia bacterium]|nr:rod shape-determining protein RodA [Actinomycetes bacterium]